MSTRLAAPARAARRDRDEWLARLDFDQAPFTIAWEVTRACAYSCLHCRADAQPRRDPGELTTEQGMKLIDDLAAFGTRPILVLTGGDPLMRRDLFGLASHATERGLRVSLTPTATALVTPKRMRLARAAGIRRVAFSVDAACAGAHDYFRGFAGSFQRTVRGMAAAASEDLALQVNTTVTKQNLGQVKRMVGALERWGTVQWSVFFLVPTGRGARLEMLSAGEHERTLEWLAEVSETAPFDVKATAAPQYRRIAIARARRANGARPAPGGASAGAGNGAALAAGHGAPGAAGNGTAPTLEHGIAGAGFQFADGLDRPVKGVNDGRGFMFVSHLGEVMPSGFLPLPAGNVKREDPVRIYRNSELFRRLRDPSLLKGKCGLCEYREVCGGSRARAFATSGDILAQDPGCPYQPRS